MAAARMKALAAVPRKESWGESVLLVPSEPTTPDEQPRPSATDGLLGTDAVLPRARAGDPAAQHTLFELFAPKLRCLLHARLPGHARGLCETDDLVQEVFARVLARLGDFQYRGPGSFWGYLRTIGLNLVGEIARRPGLQKEPSSLSGSNFDGVDPGTGPISLLMQQERFEAFERASTCLSEVHRRAVLMRMELNLPFEAIARECGFPSADAARMAVKRSLERIVELMSHDGHVEE